MLQVRVAGTSYYQAAIAAVVGAPRPGGYDQRMQAALVPDPSNAYDSNAVRVIIGGRHVGFMPRDRTAFIGPRIVALTAVHGEPVKVPCRVVGGWTKSDGGSGSFGINLGLGGAVPARARPHKVPEPGQDVAPPAFWWDPDWNDPPDHAGRRLSDNDCPHGVDDWRDCSLCMND
jgi:hypothetical protein